MAIHAERSWRLRELLLLLAAALAAGLLWGLAWQAGERAAWSAQRELERLGQVALEASELAVERWRSSAELPEGARESVVFVASGMAPGKSLKRANSGADSGTNSSSEMPLNARSTALDSGQPGAPIEGGESGALDPALSSIDAETARGSAAEAWLELAPFPARDWEPLDTGLEELRGRSVDAIERLAALEMLLELHPQARRRAEGMLDALQAAREARDAGAAERWLAQLLGRGQPREARDGFAEVLLGSLAAEGLVAAKAQADTGRRLLRWWAAGTLALPAPKDRWESDGSGTRWCPDPRYSAVLERLTAWLAVAPEAGDAALLGAAQAESRRRAEAWLERYGPALDRLGSDEHSRWTPLADSPSGWWVRLEPSGAGQAAWLSADTLESVLRRSAALIDPGFTWLPAGAPADPGAWRGPSFTALAQLPSFELEHRDPGRVLAAEVARQAPLRYGLLVLGLAVFLAGLLGARSLRRERRLGELKARFVAGISHDLRTPVASILLMAENLTQGHISLENQRGRYFPALKREAERLRRRVDDLLDFSRLERGLAARLAPEPVRLAEMIADLEAELGEDCRRAGVEFSLTKTNLPEQLSLDADALRRAVGNLVGNALRHAQTPRIDVLLTGLESAGAAGLCIEVADQGKGIPPAGRERAFLPFVQLAGTRSDAGGTGLGLSIVRELARAHGGDAEIVAQAGPGTRVRLTLMEQWTS